VHEACAILNDPPTAIEALTRLEARFDYLIARTERQRNALIHGTRPAPAVLRTVDGFVGVLNAYIAQEGIRTAETGEEPLQQLERWRIEALQRRQRLVEAHKPVDVFFPGN